MSRARTRGFFAGQVWQRFLMQCIPPQMIVHFLSGTLQDRESRIVVQHLECCVVCQQLVNRLSDGSREPQDEVPVAELAPAPMLDESSAARAEPRASEPSFLRHSRWFGRLAVSQPTPPIRSDVTVRNEDIPSLSSWATELPAKQVGRFQLQRVLGTGGFGAVYLAEDTVLHRQVALKLPKVSALVDPDLHRRFVVEARIAAGLHHPNIVTVYEASWEGELCYIASAYCSGPTLGEWARQQPEPLAARLAARILLPLADAVEYAHRNGILHRDIKPANVLLDPTPTDEHLPFTPKLSDFGLARLMTGDPQQTATGTVLGTPQYMAPEQLSGGRELGASTDIYALGAVLYELLTGRAPVVGRSCADVLRRVLLEPIIPPRRLARHIPRDLEAICLKCLEKEPNRRYARAAELAEDLRRYLADQPTKARPAGILRRSCKRAKHHPTAAAIVLTAAIAVIALLAGATWYNHQLRDLLVQAQQSEQKAQLAREVAVQENEKSERRREALRRYLYSADMQLAWRSYRSGDRRKTHELLERHWPQLGETDLRGFEWHYLWRLFHHEMRVLKGHRDDVYAVSFGDDGRLLATASADEQVRVWDTSTGRVVRVFTEHGAEVNGVAMTSRGDLVASCSDDGSVLIWKARSGEVLHRLREHEGAVYSVAFSPDGKQLATAGADQKIRLWDVESGQLVRTLTGHAGTLECLAYSPAGDLLASGSRDTTVKLWRVADGALQRTLEGHARTVLALAFTPDGTRLASGGNDEQVFLWRVADGEQLADLDGHRHWVQSLVFAPDGLLLSASRDRTVEVWNVEQRKSMGTLSGHAERVWALAFSPDGRHLVTASADKTVKFWDYQKALNERHRLKAAIRCMAIGGPSHDERLAVGDSQCGHWYVFDTSDHREVNSIMEPPLCAFTQALDTTGKRLAIAGANTEQLGLGDESVPGFIGLWDLEQNRPIWVERNHPVVPLATAWSPDEQLLAIADEGGNLQLRIAATGELRQATWAELGTLYDIAFHPNGETVAVAGRFGVSIRRVADLSEIARLAAHQQPVNGVAFSESGRLLATCSDDQTVKLWSTEGYEERGTFTGHTGGVNVVVFAPDGRSLVSGSADGTLKIWNLDSHQELFTLAGHQVPVSWAGFIEQGRVLVSGGSYERDEQRHTEILYWRALDETGAE